MGSKFNRTIDKTRPNHDVSLRTKELDLNDGGGTASFNYTALDDRQSLTHVSGPQDRPITRTVAFCQESTLAPSSMHTSPVQHATMQSASFASNLKTAP
jgi:hypothetical protein